MRYYKTNQFDQFTCVGGACSYTCCAGGWGILVDKETEKYYQSLTSEFGNYLNANLLHTDNGTFMAREKTRCTLLSDKGLCRVQQELGKDALSVVCKYFPRLIQDCGTIKFFSMTPSCPEVGRELFSYRDPLQMLVAERSESDDLPDGGESALLIRAFEVSFRILQDKKLDITARQKLFLLFNQAFQEARTAGDAEKMATLLDYFSKPQIYRTLGVAGRGKCMLAGKIRIFRELFSIYSTETLGLEISALFTDALNYLLSMEGDEKELEKLLPHFERLDTGKHAHEQENLLINSLFMHYLGKELEGDLYRQAAYIVVFNQLLRIFSALGSAKQGKLASLDERVRYLCFISRGFEHSQDIRSHLNKLLLEDGLLEMPFLFQFIS